MCEADFEVEVVTMDSDSSASRATDSLFKERLYKVKLTHFMDMDSTLTFVRKYQEIYKIKSETVKESCHAEQKLLFSLQLMGAQAYTNGDSRKMENKLSHAVDVFVQCYIGNHALCTRQS